MIRRSFIMSWPTSVSLVLAFIASASTLENCPRQCRCDSIRKTVYCMNKQLINLPLGIPTDTKRLLLQNNKLVNSPNLDYILSTLTSLEKLELSNNTLTAFPKNMPPSVTWISMKENTIKLIGSNALQGLQRLHTLYLDNNFLTNQGLSASAFRGAENLQTLSLQGNSLTRIPGGIPVKTRSLHFSKNRISHIYGNTMLHLQNVINLDLSYNLLESNSIENEAMKSMTGLRYLDLSYNRFIYVPPQLPKNISQLILSHNLLSSINMESHLYPRYKSLEGLTMLRHLDLSHNYLRNIEPDSFSDLILLKTVLLHDNPWQCDCFLRYLMNWFVDTTALLTMESNTVCFTPLVFQGVTLASLEEENLSCSPSQNPALNMTSSTNEISVSWSTSNGTNPPYTKYRVLCGELICENCSQQEIISDVAEGQKAVVTSVVKSYDIFPLDFSNIEDLRANVNIRNVKSDSLHIICLMNTYDKIDEMTIEDCKFVRTEKDVPRNDRSGGSSPPTWLIIVIAIFVILVAVGLAVLLFCWKSVTKKEDWKRRTDTAPMTYDPFRQIYTMQDSRGEVVMDATMVGGVNISNYQGGKLSATKDAGNEFDVTLVINSSSNPNLLNLQSSPATCDSYYSDSREGTLSTYHTRSNTATGSLNSRNDNNNLSHRQSITNLTEDFSNMNMNHIRT